MTLLGAVWILLIIISLFLKFKDTLILTLSSIVFTGTAFWYNGSITITIFEVAAFFLIFRYFFILRGKLSFGKINKGLLFLSFIFVLITLTNITVFNGYDIILYAQNINGLIPISVEHLKFTASTFLLLCRFVYYILVCLIVNSYITNYCDSQKREKILTSLFTFTVSIVLVCGLIQWLSIYNGGIKPIVELYHNVGEDAFTTGWDRLYSVFDEPSYCGPWLNAALWTIVVAKPNIPLRNCLVLAIATEMVLTLSSTAMICFALMFLYWIYKEKMSVKFILGCIVALFVLLIFIGFTPLGQKIVTELLGKSTSISGVSRLGFTLICYETFFKTYGLGLGYGQIQGMTLIGGLLAQVGVLGTIVFCLKMKDILFFSVRDKAILMGKTFFISILLGVEMACSGLQYSMIFWFGLLFFSVSYNNRAKK